QQLRQRSVSIDGSDPDRRHFAGGNARQAGIFVQQRSGLLQVSGRARIEEVRSRSALLEQDRQIALKVFLEPESFFFRPAHGSLPLFPSIRPSRPWNASSYG